MPSELQIAVTLMQLRLANTPAAAIIRRPGHQLWLQPDNQAQNAQQLAENAHWYGLNGPVVWTWAGAANGNATGEALARGGIAMTNCGGFNATVRWIGCNVLGLSPQVFTASFTQANEYFITRANTIAIDRNWHGNVRTLNQDFAQLGAYFFMGHSWSKYVANMLDGTTNSMNFQVKTDLYSYLLNKVYGDNPGDEEGRVFTIRRGYAPFQMPGAPPYVCISAECLKHFQHLFPIVWVGVGQGVTQSFIRGMPTTTGHGWETMLMVSATHLSAEFRRTVGLERRV